MWRHYPWLIALALAPVLFGSVGPEGQSVVGALLGISLWLLAPELGGGPATRPQRILALLLLAALVLPLIPLPASLVQLLSPERYRLAQQFPVDAGAPTAWLPLTVSIAGTVQRLWELALLVAGFLLARHAAAQPRFSQVLATTILLALGTLALSDVWYRWDGQRALLGLRETAWGKGAGTFANRNHFAGWIYAGALFCFGGILRAWWPLRAARPRLAEAPSGGTAVPALVTVLFALVMAILSGSRGGVFALGAGLLAWVILLARRSRNRQRMLLIGAIGTGLFVVLLLAGETLWSRMGEAKTDLLGRYPKVEIWKQSFALFGKYPVFGTGWGTFVTAFGHYKTSGGDSTFWHAENDLIQLVAEGGIFGAMVMLGWLWQTMRPALAQAWRGQMAEPEYTVGALAALVAFAAHGLMEFVFQITATALLAAVLLGWLAGSSTQAERPALPPPACRRRQIVNVAFASSLVVCAGLQGTAWRHWELARKQSDPRIASEEIRRSMSAWPWSSPRATALLRRQILSLRSLPPEQQPAAVAGFRQELNQSIARDPCNWELRLERAWLDAAYSPSTALVRSEVMETIALNPLQPQIPLRFAQHFLNRDPDFAARLVRRSRPRTPVEIRSALEISWRLFGKPADLWEITPATPEGLLALADFALEKQLPAVAVEACEQLQKDLRGADPVQVAERLRRAGRPDLATGVRK